MNLFRGIYRRSDGGAMAFQIVGQGMEYELPL
jgi:hypothetical protein